MVSKAVAALTPSGLSELLPCVFQHQEICLTEQGIRGLCSVPQLRRVA